MKRFALTLVALLALIVSVPVSAATVAHWDFNTDGMADGDYVLGNADTAGSYNYSVEDLSGNNNHLCGWTDTWMIYSSDTFSGSGLSITSSNDWPDARTDNDDNPNTIGVNAETITPLAWTVEALFKSTDLSGNRTIVGRDGYHVGGNTSSAAALYLSTRGTELAIDYTDVAGAGHSLQVAAGLETDTWYHVAGVSDGTTLYLYLNSVLIGTLDVSGSTDPSLGLGETNGSWTVCCGQWNKGAVDRFFGFVDEVAISDEALAPGSFLCALPIVNVSPEDGATFIPVELDDPDNDLVFAINDENIVEVDVLFGTDEEPNLIKGTVIVDGMAVSNSEYTIDLEGEISSLDYETTYYWTVIGYEPNSVSGLNDIPYQGPVTSFTTIQKSPTITDPTPSYIAVEAGEDVTLEVTAHNGDTIWYKEGTGSLIGLSGYQGADTDTLIIEDVQAEDEGYYHCIVSNLSESAQSSSARVMIQRQTSYYDFDSISVDGGNSVFVDSIDGYNAVLMQDDTSAGLPVVSDTNEINAAFGNYVVIDNSDDDTDPNGQYLQIDAGVVDYEDLTISLWVHPTVIKPWARIFDFGAGTESYMFLTADRGEDYDMRFAIGGEGSEETITGDLDSSNWVGPGNWHFITLTLSGNTGKLYHNGELITTNTEITNNPIDLGATLNYIGKSQYSSDPYFSGYIDDLKVYNYALSTVEIAEEYLAVKGGWICNKELSDLPYDYNDDCIVDLIDFATFAETWLDSNRITLSE